MSHNGGSVRRQQGGVEDGETSLPMATWDRQRPEGSDNGPEGSMTGQKGLMTGVRGSAMVRGARWGLTTGRGFRDGERGSKSGEGCGDKKQSLSALLFLFYSTCTYVDTYPRRRPSPRENQNFI